MHMNELLITAMLDWVWRIRPACSPNINLEDFFMGLLQESHVCHRDASLGWLQAISARCDTSHRWNSRDIGVCMDISHM
jgi:hypothetical protein